MIVTLDEIIKDSNAVIHVASQEQTDALLEQLNEKGKTWIDGTKYEKGFYSHYGSDTCVLPFYGEFSPIDYYERSGYKIYEFSDILDFQEPKESADSGEETADGCELISAEYIYRNCKIKLDKKQDEKNPYYIYDFPNPRPPFSSYSSLDEAKEAVDLELGRYLELYEKKGGQTEAPKEPADKENKDPMVFSYKKFLKAYDALFIPGESAQKMDGKETNQEGNGMFRVFDEKRGFDLIVAPDMVESRSEWLKERKAENAHHRK